MKNNIFLSIERPASFEGSRLLEGFYDPHGCRNRESCIGIFEEGENINCRGGWKKEPLSLQTGRVLWAATDRVAHRPIYRACTVMPLSSTIEGPRRPMAPISELIGVHPVDFNSIPI